MKAAAVDDNFYRYDINNKPEHFAYGFNSIKLFWITFFGSIVGYLVETIWCIVKNGHIASRSSLVIGPFNLVYGFGALALYLCLRSIKKERKMLLFWAGIGCGTFIEYICSFAQEKAFGTVSWDYSSFPLNINGRVCLLYSLFWGFLALLWVFKLEPFFVTLMLKLPDSLGRNLAVILLVFLAVDVAISAAAVARWTMRTDGIQASTAIGQQIDNYFPNNLMEILYPNMKSAASSLK